MSIDDPRAELVSLLPRLRRFAYGLTGNAQAADDLVQAGCLKAIERWHQWQPGTSLASWMFRILQTTWVDDYRAHQRHQTVADSEALDALAGEDGRIVVEARSDARVVRKAIAQLPEEQRMVLMMITIDGLSYREAAQTLGVPVGTVMSRLARARGKLADTIGVGD
nr:RNA polymerase sigma factor [Zoogloeaceae bacterium]